jgi:hypothetical protein
MATTKRSRRRANEVAGQTLGAGNTVIVDAQVLEVLRMWRFKVNKTRKNVCPEGRDHVFSDTLGLVSCRDGRTCLTKLTRDNPAMFRLLCSWLKSNRPAVFQRHFAFTSISVNHNYAARIHRDNGNMGPSMTRSFGQYTGGRLKYWANDDGVLQVDQLLAYPSQEVDTQQNLTLFDGNRAHMVAPFEGERYSLVYFTQQCFQRAKPVDLSFLEARDAPAPQLEDIEYFRSQLAPPRGYSKGCVQPSIRRCIGLDEKPAALTWRVVRLEDVCHDAMQLILAFVLTPIAMDTICAVCKNFSAKAWDDGSWADSKVDTTGYHPAGPLARCHYRLWAKAVCVVSSPWNFSDISLLMHQTFRVWKFVGNEFRAFRGYQVMVSQFPVTPCNVNIMIANRHAGPLAIVVTNTRDPYEILDCHAERNPRDGRCCFAALFTHNRRQRAFSWDGQPLGGRPLPPSSLNGLVCVSYFVGLLQVSIDGQQRVAATTGNWLNTSEDHFCALIAEGSGPPDIDAVPCWSWR